MTVSRTTGSDAGSGDHGWGDERATEGRHLQGSGPNGNGRKAGEAPGLARALGWLSLGLGLTQLAAPEKVARMVGIGDEAEAQRAMRAVGLREIASGLGILTQDKTAPWLWARVGGDAMDLALLRKAMTSGNADRGRLTTAAAAIAGIAAVDALCGMQLTREEGAPANDAMREPEPETRVTAAITVNAPAERVYASWDGFRDLPQFMQDFATVEVLDARQSRWRRSLPGGMAIAWDVTIGNAVPNESIEWRSGEGSGVDASGHVRFRPAPRGQGTEVLFVAEFAPPGGELGQRIAGLFTGALGTAAQSDLRRSKQLIEVGEIVASDDSVVPGPNPARPSGKVSEAGAAA